MSDQGDHSDIEEEKLLGKDESEEADSAPMTWRDFQIITKQNERIFKMKEFCRNSTG